MKILIHDYPGHAFPVELSRALAARGHETHHLTFGEFQAPKGPLDRRPDDPDTFLPEALALGEPFEKYSLPRRLRQELRYGRLLADRVEQIRPHVMLGNGPLDVQRAGLRAAHRCNAAHIAWWQDIYSAAIDSILRTRLGLPGRVAGWWYRRMERMIMAQSDAIVGITPRFFETLRGWGVPEGAWHILPNWAPLDDVTPGPKDNAWSQGQGLADRPVVLYAGTLGWKHDPAMILALAQGLAQQSSPAIIVVASEGPGPDWLRDQATEHSLSNLRVLPFQPAAQVASMLASADVMLAMIEPSAAEYSVPSKILAYLNAGRPVVLAAAASNDAAGTIRDAQCGFVVDPGDKAAFTDAARRLLENPGDAVGKGRAGRAFAEAHFAIGPITDRFEAIFRQAAAGR